MKTKLIVFCALMVGMNLHAGETLKYSDLVERLYDMKRLTTQPEKGEKSAGTTDYYGVVPAEDRAGYYVPATPKKPTPVINGKYEDEGQ